MSHLTLHLSQFCQENGIVLISLYPNATHLLQPMDVAVFRTVKAAWREKIHEWRTKNMHQQLKKVDFSGIQKIVLSETVTYSVLANGFRKCGLIPWCPDAVDYGKIKVMAATQNKKQVAEEISVTFLQELVG